jgi:glycosyltransferase involved in cell wall biosynthesis
LAKEIPDMPRLLIVSPHFPPVNAPDMQRVRMTLPYFVEAGWDVTVLTVDDPTPTAPVEQELSATVPKAVRVERTHCFSRGWTGLLGVNNVALRALPFLFFRGCRLLAGQRYDVVYFSTTMFIVLPFGRIWRRLSGVPYVIDLQDPWVTDFYDRPGAPPPPGGWKYRVARRLGLLLEGWSLRQVSHLITVSAAYITTLRHRYAALQGVPFTELPFGSPDSDLQHVRKTWAQRKPILPAGGFRLGFAGAIGPGMLPLVEVLFAAMAELKKAGTPVSAHFYGTSYSHRDQPAAITAALAAKHGLADCVFEQSARLRYFDALQVTLEAETNLLFGSVDLDYTPSKIITLIAAGRPILAFAHSGSALAARLAELGVPCVIINGEHLAPAVIQATLTRLLAIRSRQGQLPALPTDFSADELSRRQMAVLNSVGHGPPDV